MSEIDIVLKEMASKKFKSLVPNHLLAQCIDLLGSGKKNLLEYRTVAEKAAAVQDHKRVAKKTNGDQIAKHRDELAEFKKCIKACRATTHVYLQDP